MQQISLQGTQELMTHQHTALILATGGTPMVKAAHSTGKPAYGVGPGNVPVYVDRSADLEKAARYIVAHKAFDYSTICATEQAVIADLPIAAQLAELMQAEGAYFTNPRANRSPCASVLFHPDGSINTAAGRQIRHSTWPLWPGFEVPAGYAYPGLPAYKSRQG